MVKKKFDEKRLASFFLRIGLATVFLYAGISAFLNPIAWIGFIPLWLRNIISYSFFFGLSLTLHDREFARYILYGLSEGWSRRALYWLEQVKRTDHDINTHLWGHAINVLTILTREMSPRESAPDVDPKVLNEVGRLVGKQKLGPNGLI